MAGGNDGAGHTKLSRRQFAAGIASAALMISAPETSFAALRFGGRKIKVLNFQDLEGWHDDDHRAALSTWLRSSNRSPLLDGLSARGAAPGAQIAPRGFFEREFTPVLVGPRARPLFTGYYEPVVRASRVRTPIFHVPIYGPPKDLGQRSQHYTRGEIYQGALQDQGLELFWLSDPVEKYFLQIQGSGRLELADGKMVRIGFAAKNGHPYRSIGGILRETGYHAEAMTAGGVKSWLRADPVRGAAMMARNPSYIFFKIRRDLDAAEGPVGAAGVPLTDLRSIAIDNRIYPYGLPHWVETDGMARLMIGQDTGSAIKGAQRADLYFGTGRDAGRKASRMYFPGRLITLVPRDRVAALTGDFG